MNWVLLCLLLLPMFSPSSSAQEQINKRIDPNIKYSVLISPNFEIIFQKEQRSLAQAYLLAAEQAFDLLLPIFREAPKKTYIFLRDDTDISNGLANFLPYPIIEIYPVLPPTQTSVDEYGDWALEMMVHEYTHILNIYSQHGFYRPLGWIFGNVIRPNAILPRWYLEGLAVNLESRLTSHGRLRAPQTRAMARALVLSGQLQFEDIARINETRISSWPQGERPYLYGGWWWNHVQSTSESGTIYKLNQHFARRLPFLLNGPIREQTGFSVNENLNAAYDKIETEALKEIEVLRRSITHQSESIVNESGDQSLFAISPSGNRLVYWLREPQKGSLIKLKTRSSPKQPFGEIPGEALSKSISSIGGRWLDDDNLVTDQMDIDNPYYDYRDLYIFNIPERRWSRLTFGQRAQEPSPSPSRARIAFIQNDAGRNRLSLLERSSGKIHVLIQSEIGQRISSPEFFSETQILYILRERSGRESIHVYDIEKKSTHAWSDSMHSTQSLRLTRAGLLFTDASSNVRNAYLDTKTKSPIPITNTLTSIGSADYDPQREEILFTELTADGRKLRTMNLKPFSPPILPKAPLPSAPNPNLKTIKVTESGYQPLNYMLPRYWIPFVYQVENGWIFQGLTNAEDPVGRNRYSLLGAYDTVTRKGTYGASITNSSLSADISASYNKSQNYLGASTLTIETQSAELLLSKPLWSRYREFEMGTEWNLTDGAKTLTRMGPRVGFTYSSLKDPRKERLGLHARAVHRQFLQLGDSLAYGHTSLHVGAELNLVSGHRVLLQGRSLLAPNLPFSQVIALGDRNVGGNYLINLVNSQFLLRGYPSGAFIGRKVVNANLEFVLPSVEVLRGWGTFPFFLRNLEFVAFTDGIAVDGAGFSTEANRYLRSGLSEYYLGSGAELRLYASAAYHMPINFTFGLYYGWNERMSGGFTPFLSLGLGDLSSLSF